MSVKNALCFFCTLQKSKMTKISNQRVLPLITKKRFCCPSLFFNLVCIEYEASFGILLFLCVFNTLCVHTLSAVLGNEHQRVLIWCTWMGECACTRAYVCSVLICFNVCVCLCLGAYVHIGVCVYMWVCTAWDSEIESLTSLDASLIELDRRKTRHRRRETAALAPSKSCLLPCHANLHASSASLKHGLRLLFEWSSFLAHWRVVISHAIVKIRCKKETVESWQKLTTARKGSHTFVLLHSFSFIFSLPRFVLRRSKCSEWLLLGVATTN